MIRTSLAEPVESLPAVLLEEIAAPGNAWVLKAETASPPPSETAPAVQIETRRGKTRSRRSKTMKRLVRLSFSVSLIAVVFTGIVALKTAVYFWQLNPR